MMPAIDISEPRWDPASSSLLIDVRTVEERLTCRISVDALRRIRTSTDPSLHAAAFARAAFAERRDDLIDVVRRLVWDRRISADGQIRIIADTIPPGW